MIDESISKANYMKIILGAVREDLNVIGAKQSVWYKKSFYHKIIMLIKGDYE